MAGPQRTSGEVYLQYILVAGMTDMMKPDARARAKGQDLGSGRIMDNEDIIIEGVEAKSFVSRSTRPFTTPAV